MRFLLMMIAAVTFSVPATAWASERDGTIVEQIASALRGTAELKGCDFSVSFSGGTAILRGTVKRTEQVAAALAATRAVPGVAKVVDDLNVRQTDSGSHGGSRTVAGAAPQRTAAANSHNPLRQANAATDAAGNPPAAPHLMPAGGQPPRSSAAATTPAFTGAKEPRAMPKPGEVNRLPPLASRTSESPPTHDAVSTKSQAVTPVLTSMEKRGREGGVIRAGEAGLQPKPASRDGGTPPDVGSPTLGRRRSRSDKEDASVPVRLPPLLRQAAHQDTRTLPAFVPPPPHLQQRCGAPPGAPYGPHAGSGPVARANEPDHRLLHKIQWWPARPACPISHMTHVGASWGYYPTCWRQWPPCAPSCPPPIPPEAYIPHGMEEIDREPMNRGMPELLPAPGPEPSKPDDKPLELPPPPPKTGPEKGRP
jgi:hypothetical protein